jgi:hypothetical protein
MGHRRIPTIYTFDEIPDEEGLIVRFKAIKIGKLRKLARLIEMDDDHMLEQMDELFTLMGEGLVSWNLEDEDGNAVEASLEGIEDQDFPFILKLLKLWLGEMTGPDEELGKDSVAGATFPGSPLRMEAL